MPVAPVTLLINALRDSRLLSAAQQKELAQDLQARYPDPRVLARHLIERGWLTPYQVNQLFQGRGTELVLGPYFILERLGEGGTGQVFKGRHQRMQRIDAVKVIRPELLTDPEVVARFYREVQVLSKMSHPNVVHAYDAGPVGPTHFLAMEFVEGIDLARLVKQNGPLPAAQACEFIRQAACGLAHAHEKGLIHRDVKPSNLLVSGGVVSGEWSQNTTHHSPLTTHQVKILDLGLARLRRIAEGDITTTLTVVGSGDVTMGTPDYLAPEQAINFHDVDIRADIYSLGCTFYHLLTGQSPFAGGTMAQKLLCHQQAEPPPLKRFRADVAPALETGLRRMLAKRPADRFQTPADVVSWLTTLEVNGKAGSTFVQSSISSITGILRRRPVAVEDPTLPNGNTLAQPRRTTQVLRQRRWLLAAVAGVVLLLLGGLLILALVSPSRTDPSLAARTSKSTSPERPLPPTGAMPLDREFVLQGRSHVRDVLLDPARPQVRLGGNPKDNAITKQRVSAAFLVHFDLGKVGLRAPSRVESATLSFFVWDPSNSANTKVCAFAVKTPWEEATATWQQSAEGKAWQGGTNVTYGVDTSWNSPHVVVKPDAPGTDTAEPPLEYQLDVTGAVRDWLNGSLANHGLAIGPVSDRAIDDGHQTRFQIYASEHGRVQYTPRLSVRLQP